MKNTLSVLRFEYKGFVGAKSFRITTIILACAIIIGASVPQLLGTFQSIGIGGGSGENSNEDKAAIILSGEALANDIYRESFAEEALTAAIGLSWENLSRNPPDEAALAESIQSGEYMFALRYSGGAEYEFFAAGNRLSSYSSIEAVTGYITETIKRTEIAKLPEETQEAVMRISSLTAIPKIIDIGGNAESNYWIGYVLIMFLFYVIMGYTNYVASSIITEKTSKAMELLVTSVKPLHLMVGKVVGVGFAALTQVGILVAAFAAGILINLPYWKATGSGILAGIQGGNLDASIAVIVVVYFLLGFFLYAFLAAAFASTASKPEDAATVTLLPMLLIAAALALGFLTLTGAGSKTLVAVLSYVPFFTPINMVARYTIGDAGEGQLVIGAIVMAVAIALVAILAAKIFRMGVMLYGVKLTPKQIWKALKTA